MTKRPPRKSAVRAVPTWDRDELAYVLEAAATNSVNKAAANLGVSPATVTSRIALLEKRLGYRIFDRSPRGAFLTARGERIVSEAQTVFNTLETFERNASREDQSDAARVRLSLTDGIATLWVAPRIGMLRENKPEVSLECMTGEEPADPFRAQADLSIRLRAPETSEFVVRSLGHLHFIPYASKDYLKANGEPRHVRDLSAHRIVDHSSYENRQGPWYTWTNASSLPGKTSLRTNIGAMTDSAVENGVGIGLLPSYVSLVSDKLVALDLDIHMRNELWLCYLKSTGDSKGRHVVARWLQAIFSPKQYPCFEADFVHPREFGKI